MSSNIDVTGELDFPEKPVSLKGRMSRLAGGNLLGCLQRHVFIE